MGRLFLSLLLVLAFAAGAGEVYSDSAGEELPLAEEIDIEMEETPAEPAQKAVPGKISNKPSPPSVVRPTAPKKAIEPIVPVLRETGETAIEPASETPEPSIEERKLRPTPAGPPPKGFEDFLGCGIALGEAPVTFDSQILGRTGQTGSYAVNGQEVIVEGIHPEGMKFAVYRVRRGACVAYYLGEVSILGQIDELTCRGLVNDAKEPIGNGDVLYSYDSVRADFEDQRQMEGDEKDIKTTVRCIPGDRRWLHGGREVIQLNAGRSAGVLYGQMFQISLPGYAGKKTYGRVIRVDPGSCFLKIAKLYQMLEVGNKMESVARPGGQAPLSLR